MEGRAEKKLRTTPPPPPSFVAAVRPQPGDTDATICARIRDVDVGDIHATDARGRAALHAACRWRLSAEVLRVLVDECGANVHAICVGGGGAPVTALDFCILNGHGDGVAFLRSRGAQVDARNPDSGSTLLMLACYNGDIRTVCGLLQHGADYNATDGRGYTVMWYALSAKPVSLDVIRALLDAGVPIDTPLLRHYVSHGANGHALALLPNPLPEGVLPPLKGEVATITHADPLGFMVEGARLGAGILATRHVLRKKVSCNAKLLWASLRTGEPPLLDGSKNDVCTLMVAVDDPACWQMLAREWGPNWQHPMTRESLLHVAARGAQPSMTYVLMNEHVNPLLCNLDGKRCWELPALDKTLVARLREYATWTPHRFRTRWYGPYFEMRAVAFAMVCKRLGISRDVMYCVLKRLADTEYTYVVKK